MNEPVLGDGGRVGYGHRNPPKEADVERAAAAARDQPRYPVDGTAEVPGPRPEEPSTEGSAGSEAGPYVSRARQAIEAAEEANRPDVPGPLEQLAEESGQLTERELEALSEDPEQLPIAEQDAGLPGLVSSWPARAAAADPKLTYEELSVRFAQAYTAWNHGDRTQPPPVPPVPPDFDLGADIGPLNPDV